MSAKRQRPEEIIGEWGVRDVTPPSQVERERLDSDRDVNPLVGRPLRRRIRNFRAEPDSYIASLGGPLPYMQRLRTARRPKNSSTRVRRSSQPDIQFRSKRGLGQLVPHPKFRH